MSIHIKNDPPLTRGTPTLAVMLSNYNMGSYVDRAFASLDCQQTHADQIVMVNDGSTDDSSERMQFWMGKLPGAQLFETRNQGKARALNTVLPYIDTDFVLELDADDWLDANAVLHIRSMLGLLSGTTHLLYGNLRTWKFDVHSALKRTGTRVGRQISHPQSLIKYPLPLGPRIYRTSSLKSIGGFPVSSFADGRLYEDVLVIRELMKLGEVAYRNFTVYNVLQHPESITSINRSSWSTFVKRVL